MFACEIVASESVRLVKPEVERDASLGVGWLAGDRGRKTLRLMGVTDANNRPTTLEAERIRVKYFLENKDTLNWAIESNEYLVGAIWVDLKSSRYLKSPAVHIMIGDKSARGKGVGSSAFKAVLEYLEAQGSEEIYSRHLTGHYGSKNLLEKLGFKNDGMVYKDKDNLSWQNVILI